MLLPRENFRIEEKITICVRTDTGTGLLTKQRTDVDKEEGVMKLAKFCGHPLRMAP